MKINDPIEIYELKTKGFSSRNGFKVGVRKIKSVWTKEIAEDLLKQYPLTDKEVFNGK